MSTAPPQLVADRYRLVQPLGQGGMGRVWRARDEVLHRDVAIKELVPPSGLTEDERREMRERTLREARAIAQLNHINVVRIFDVLRTDGDPWIVMEYVPSRSLQEVLASDGPVPAARAADIGLGVLGALRAAHRAGVMHRDVKPGNVLLGEDGRVVLTDFGLATVPGDPTVTRTGLVLGSPAYIAPERAKDGTAGPEADLWSLGATLYAAVEGQSPYARNSAIATLAALATEPLPVPKNAGPLRPVLTGLLRKDPASRIKLDEADRLLRRAAGRRRRAGVGLLDGVRRPSPLGPREPRASVVPAPRPPADKAPVAPPPVASLPPTVVAPASAEKGVASPPAKPIGSAPVPVAVPVGGDPYDESGTRERFLAGSRRAWLIGGLIALLLLAIVVILPLATSGPNDDGGAQPGGGPSTAAAGSPSAGPETSPPRAAPTSVAPVSPPARPAGTPAPVVPAGWYLYRDATGFSVPVPKGWRISRSADGVRFEEPGGRRFLLIAQTDSPKADPVKDWETQEAARRSGYREYERIRIVAVDYWDKAADWEFRYTSNRGNRIHVLNRGFVTAPDKAYSIYWSTPDPQWSDYLGDLKVITDGFRPVRS